MRAVANTSHPRSVIKPFLIVAAALALGTGLASAATDACLASAGCGASLPAGIRDPSADGNAQPPNGFGPKAFSLSVTGRTKDGATATPIVARPLHFGILVEKPTRAIGMVRFGELQQAGPVHLHWNFKVDGKPLPVGKYLVFAEVLTTQNLPTGVPPSQDEAILTLTSDGHDAVRMVTINYPSPCAGESCYLPPWRP